MREGACDLFCFALDGGGNRADLSDEERRRAESFLRTRDADRFVAARVGLRRVLGAVLERDPKALHFVYGPQGKPALADGALEFNLSHAGDRALVVVSQGRAVGVDLEPLRVDFDPLALSRFVFTDAERDALQGLRPEERPAAFLACWTAKEAVAKADGGGLGSPWLRRTLWPTPEPGLAVRWQAVDLGPGWQAAVAGMGAAPLSLAAVKSV